MFIFFSEEVKGINIVKKCRDFVSKIVGQWIKRFTYGVEKVGADFDRSIHDGTERVKRSNFHCDVL